MAGLEDDTIGGFNAMIEKQKKEPGQAYVSMVLFGSKERRIVMLEFIIVALFIWLFADAVRLAFKTTWRLAKAAAAFLFVVALPARSAA